MSFSHQFRPAEWQALRFAPFLILSGVSGRYRDFAVEERQAFDHWLGEASRSPGSLSREVLESVVADAATIETQFGQYDATVASGLTTVGRILADQPATEAGLFRGALIGVLGAGLACARGPYGTQPTAEAAQVLRLLEDFLIPQDSGGTRNAHAA